MQRAAGTEDTFHERLRRKPRSRSSPGELPSKKDAKPPTVSNASRRNALAPPPIHSHEIASAAAMGKPFGSAAPINRPGSSPFARPCRRVRYKRQHNVGVAIG